MVTMGLSFEYHDGADPCVTLLHGFPLDRAMWVPTIDALRRSGRRVLAPDLRGFGHSGITVQESIEDMTGDVVALWDALGITRSVVVGASMGGYLALDAAVRHEDRLAALVLVDTRAEPDTAEARERRREEADHAVQHGLRELADAMVPKQLTESSAQGSLGTVVHEMILRQSPAGVAAALRAMGQRKDMRSRMDAIDTPTLVVVGEHDQITPLDCARTLQQGIAGARLVTIPGAAHLVPLEAPGPWTEALLGFLDDTYGPVPGAAGVSPRSRDAFS